jgi:hypothetical protein
MIAALAVAVATSLDWLALPIATYNTDDGFAAGAVARVEWQDREGATAMLGAQVLISTAGMQSDYLRLDLPRPFGTRMRLRLAGEFYRDPAAPYYGLGNRSSASLAEHPGVDPAHAFEYARTFPLAIAELAVPLNDSGLRLTFIARYSRLTVHPYAGSLLARDRPLGFEGGDESSSEVGLLLDRRDHQVAPTRGYLLEASLRGALSGAASSYTWAGAAARALGFVPFGDRVVLGGRVQADFLTGSAPLYELSRFGGVERIEGVGGQSSLRGVPRARYVGRTKLLASLELRVRTFDARLFGKPLSFGVAGFVDTGRVWQPGLDAGRPFDLHPGAGGGLRMYHREVVVRLDVATSADRPIGAYFALGSFF